jgi:outer membrane porin, OprD family
VQKRGVAIIAQICHRLAKSHQIEQQNVHLPLTRLQSCGSNLLTLGGARNGFEIRLKASELSAGWPMRSLKFQSLHGSASGARRVLTASAIGLCLAWFGSIAQSRAQSLVPADRQEVADEDKGIWTLQKLPSQQYMHEIYWPYAPDVAPFFRDSLVQIVARTYYLNRLNSNGTISQAWTGGGWIAYRSGLIADMFGVHAALYTSQPFFAPGDEGGTKLLTSDQSALNSLGQAYGRMQILDQELRGGRQLVDTPLINPQDNRMVPNTFEGTQLVTLPDKERSYDYAIGFMSEIKQRDSNAFVSMSQALVGATTPINNGAYYAMVKWRPLPGLSTVAMDYQVNDFINTGFAQAEYDFRQPKGVPNWILGANIIDQTSNGSNLLTGMPFQTYQASAKVQTSYVGWTAFAAGSATGDQQKIFSPFGTKPNYTDMQQVSFDNANEKAVGASLAYDLGYAFGKYGFSGLSVGVWDTQGWDAINPSTGAAIANRNELNVWAQYRPTSGPLQGLRVKVQYSDLWQAGNIRNPQPEFRFIVDYTVLFRPPVK